MIVPLFFQTFENVRNVNCKLERETIQLKKYV
jgi:hypothetical protein